MCIAEPCGSSDMCSKCVCNPEMEKLELLGIIQDKDKAIAELKEDIKCLEHNCNVKQEMNDRQYDYGLNLLSRLNKAKKIIQNLMGFAEMDDREYEPEYKEAELFLEEE